MRRRLTADELAQARELGVGQSLEEGIWRVCEEYKLVEPTGEGAYLVAAYPDTRKDKWRTVRPLEENSDLLIEFVKAYESCFEERSCKHWSERSSKESDYLGPILRWVRRYGLLGIGHGGRGWRGGKPEWLLRYISEMQQAADVLYLYESVLNEDEEEARDLLAEYQDYRTVEGLRCGEDGKLYVMDPLEHALLVVTQIVTEKLHILCYVTAIPPVRSHDVSKIRAGWSFRNLLGPMYLQMYWHIAAQSRIKRCKFCSSLIPNPREDQETCNSRCRAKWNYHHGTGKSSKQARKQVRKTRP